MTDITGRAFELVGAMTIASITGAQLDLSSRECQRTVGNVDKCDPVLVQTMEDKMFSYLGAANSITPWVNEGSRILFTEDCNGAFGDKADVVITNAVDRNVKISFKHNSVELGSHSMSEASFKSGITKLPYRNPEEHAAIFADLATIRDQYRVFNDVPDTHVWRQAVFNRMAKLDASEFNAVAETDKPHLCSVLSNIIGYTDGDLIVVRLKQSGIEEKTGFHPVVDFGEAVVSTDKLYIPITLADGSERTFTSRYKFRSSRTQSTSVKTSVEIRRATA